MKVNSSHSMTCSLLNKERNPGHSGIVTGFNSGRRKKAKRLAHRPLVPKCHFFVREIWEKNLQFEDRSQQIKMPAYSQTPGGHSPTKRIFSSGQKSAL